MGLLDFLSQNNSSKEIVGISITPGIGLEVAVYNKATNSILNYGRCWLEYNLATREIQNYAEFKTSLINLVEKMFIKLRTPVYLVLPNVYLDSVEVPADIDDTGINMAILSKAEEFYLFKREEPETGHCEIIDPTSSVQRRFIYSSFQKVAIDEFKSIIAEVGLTLVGIETSYSATLRGLRATGLLDSVIDENASWTTMIIGSNNYTLFQMNGGNLVNFSENPIAIKSFSQEEAYQAIVSSSYQVLSNFPSNKLFVISQTDEICAQTLKSLMQFDREIVAIDSNKYSTEPIIEVKNALDQDEAKEITLNVIGASCIDTDIDINMNLMKDKTPLSKNKPYFTKMIMGREVEVNAAYVQNMSLVILIALAIFFGGIIGGLSLLNNKLQTEAKEKSDKISQVQAEIDSLSKQENKQVIDMNAIIDEIAAMNIEAIKYYDSISTDIPKNIWLTQYYNQAGDKIAVRGIGQSIIDIYEYYKNMRAITPESEIKLNELKVVTNANNSSISDLILGSGNNRLYSFEISNAQVQFNEIRGTKDSDSGSGGDNSGQSRTYNPSLQVNEDIIITPSTGNSSNGENANVEQPSSQVQPIK